MHFTFCQGNESKIPGPYIPQQHDSAALPRTQESLQRLNVLARLIAPRWVRQFLFTTDPVQTAILTSPCAMNNAVTTKRVESNFIHSQNSTQPCAIQAQCESVDMPFISIDGFITGVGVTEIILRPLFRNSSPFTCAFSAFKGKCAEVDENIWSLTHSGIKEHSRSVRILGGQIGLFVHTRAYALHYIFVETFEFQSRTRRTRTNFIFHAKEFRRITMPPVVPNESFQNKVSIVDSGNGTDGDIPPKAEDLQTALALVQIIVEHCACQNCAFQTHCSCGPRKVTPSSHAFDARAFRESVGRQDGIFRGIEVFNQCNIGAQILSAKLGVEHRGHTGRDKRIISRCVDWAIGDILMNKTLRIIPSALETQKINAPNGDLKSFDGCDNDTHMTYGYFGDLHTLDEDVQTVSGHGYTKVSDENPPIKILEDAIPVTENIIIDGNTDKITEARVYRSKNMKTNLENCINRGTQHNSKVLKRGRRPSVQKNIVKRKIKSEELKKNVDHLRKYMTMLSERERALRVENSRLRTACAHHIHTWINKK